MNKYSFSNLLFNAFEQPAVPAAWYMPAANYQVQTFAEFEAARESIEQLAFPEANWDGYGALPISLEAKSNALTALYALEKTAPAPAVIPNANGTLSFEWETELGVSHLEIGRTRYSFYVRPNIGRTILVDGSASQINRLLGSFVDLLYSRPSQPATANISPSSNV
jgi:hypothetical protein